MPHRQPIYRLVFQSIGAAVIALLGLFLFSLAFFINIAVVLIQAILPAHRRDKKKPQ